MYPASFRYHRVRSLNEAATLLSQLGEDSKVIAGGQSLIPLMKLRLAEPSDLIDLNFIPDLDFIRSSEGELRIGTLSTHAQIASSDAARAVPILGDCAEGIADRQIRAMGTIGGSIAEADPSGDWAPVLLALSARIVCTGSDGQRTVPLADFIADAYSNTLKAGELVSEVQLAAPGPRSGGAYLAFKRSAQVYATASVAAQLRLDEGGQCRQARIVLGSVGLTPISASDAAEILGGSAVEPSNIERAAEAAAEASEPMSDMRGSADYKRHLIKALVKRALSIALRRCRGETVNGAHEYV